MCESATNASDGKPRARPILHGLQPVKDSADGSQTDAANNSLLVKVIVDLLRRRFRDAFHCQQILQRGAAHRLGRTEMVQQRTLAAWSDAADLVEWIAHHLLLAAGT